MFNFMVVNFDKLFVRVLLYIIEMNSYSVLSSPLFRNIVLRDYQKYKLNNHKIKLDPRLYLYSHREGVYAHVVYLKGIEFDIKKNIFINTITTLSTLNDIKTAYIHILPPGSDTTCIKSAEGCITYIIPILLPPTQSGVWISSLIKNKSEKDSYGTIIAVSENEDYALYNTGFRDRVVIIVEANVSKYFITLEK